MRFDKYDIAMAKLAARVEESRPVLSCVHVKDGYLEVADGFVLIRRDLDLEREEQAPAECLIPAKMMAQIQPGQRKLIPNTTIDPETHIITTKYVRFGGFPAEHEPTFSFRDFSTQATYPKTDQLFRDCPTEKKCTVGFTVGILKSVLNAMPDNGIISFGINKPNEAVEFSVHNMDNKIHGLIMPVNLYQVQESDLWLERHLLTPEPAINREAEAKPEPTPEPPHIVVN